MKVKDYVQLIKYSYSPYDCIFRRDSIELQILNNLKKIKKVTLKLAHERNVNQCHEVRDIEVSLHIIIRGQVACYIYVDKKITIMELEVKKTKKIEDIEVDWRFAK